MMNQNRVKLRVLLSVISGVTLSLAGSALTGCKDSEIYRDPVNPVVLSEHERLLTILGTNDIHGGLEPSTLQSGEVVGGTQMLAATFSAIRRGLNRQFGDRAATITLDGGDQFQGTLLSNFSEGRLAFRALSEVGYDAMVLGNHGYDFGPRGWLEDQVTPTTHDQDPRGALKRALKEAKFPIVSANTYYKASLKDPAGGVIEVDGNGCATKKPIDRLLIDWSRAERPKFFKPYVIVKRAGLNVALIGIDNAKTPSSTTASNVSDLCFDDEFDSYVRAREEIGDSADLFVLVMHQGNSSNEFSATTLVRRLKRLETTTGRPMLHAAVAGHTHFINKSVIENVPLIQSSANGRMYGRVDLIIDSRTKQVVTEKTRLYAGISLYRSECANPVKEAFCERVMLNAMDVKPELKSELTAALERDELVKNPLFIEGALIYNDTSARKIKKILDQAKAELAPTSERVLGEVTGPLRSHRSDESTMGNAISDLMREATGVQVAFVNTGGLRAPLSAGVLTYNDLFQVLPFGNRVVSIGPMKMDTLMRLLLRSARSCGSYGALMQSGLRVEFEKDCDAAKDGVDEKASLVRVKLLSTDEVLYDRASGGIMSERELGVATLDFLHAGGSGYSDFKAVPLIEDRGIFRETLVESMLKKPVRLEPNLDGRWKALKP